MSPVKFMPICMLVTLLMAGWHGTTARAAPLGTQFTYQGQLKEAGAPFPGASATMTFFLFNDSAAGIQVGSFGPISVPLTGGLFTATLDYGSDVFNGDARWLEIIVDGVALSPRQEITVAPYALQTRGIFVDAAKNVGIGTTAPGEKLTVAGAVQSTAGGFKFPDGSVQTTAAVGDGHSLDAEDGDPVDVLRVTAGGQVRVGFSGISPLIPAQQFEMQQGAGQHRLFGAGGQTAVLIGPSSGGFGGRVIIQSGGLPQATMFINPSGQGQVDAEVGSFAQLFKSAGMFRIDHPLDPKNRFLLHSFVESPDMMNIYNGITVTNERGYAQVTMPNWFEALNRDFRYQLTVVDEDDADEFVLVKIVREINGNQFVIRSNTPHTKVSWQVTGIRRDAYAKAHPMIVEMDKPENMKGTYIHPELYVQAEHPAAKDGDSGQRAVLAAHSPPSGDEQ